MHCATASLNADKLLVNSSCYECWLDLYVNCNKTASNQISTCKAKHFLMKFEEYGLQRVGQNSILLSSTKRVLH